MHFATTQDNELLIYAAAADQLTADETQEMLTKSLIGRHIKPLKEQGYSLRVKSFTFAEISSLAAKLAIPEEMLRNQGTAFAQIALSEGVNLLKSQGRAPEGSKYSTEPLWADQSGSKMLLTIVIAEEA